jgi:hypothetical protein
MSMGGIDGRKILIFQFSGGRDEFDRDLPEKHTVVGIRNKIECHLQPRRIGFVAGANQNIRIDLGANRDFHCRLSSELPAMPAVRHRPFHAMPTIQGYGLLRQKS